LPDPGARRTEKNLFFDTVLGTHMQSPGCRLTGARQKGNRMVADVRPSLRL
jgi:hypothetical protein